MIWYGTSVDINVNKSTLKLKYFHLLVFSNLLIIYQKNMFNNRLKSYKLQKHSNSRLPDSQLTLKPIAQLRENYKTNLDFIDQIARKYVTIWMCPVPPQKVFFLVFLTTFIFSLSRREDSKQFHSTMMDSNPGRETQLDQESIA